MGIIHTVLSPIELPLPPFERHFQQKPPLQGLLKKRTPGGLLEEIRHILYKFPNKHVVFALFVCGNVGDSLLPFMCNIYKIKNKFDFRIIQNKNRESAKKLLPNVPCTFFKIRLLKNSRRGGVVGS